MKLTVIGGCGSRSLMLAKSLAQQATELKLTEIVFLDTDIRQLDIFGSMVREAFARIEPSIRLVCTNHQKEAVFEADFIITTVRAGKPDSRITDEKIALKHGVIGQETTGAGGFAMALRSIPVLLHYCELIREYANPDVMVFNFTNPAGLVTQALRDQGYDFVYGICDAPSGLLRQVTALYGGTPDKFEVQLFGLNHLSYFTSIKQNGMEMLPEILRNPKLYEKTDMRYFEPELAECDAGTEFDKMLDIYSNFTYQRESNYMQGETSKARNGECIPRFDLYSEDEGGYAGVALALMRAKITGQEGEMILCIPNQGTVSWLLDTDVIEVSCNISKDGAVPKSCGYNLPESAKQLISTVKYYERTAARAITEHNSKMAVDALMAHPLVNSYSLAKEILRDYLEVYQDYTGGFQL